MSHLLWIRSFVIATLLLALGAPARATDISLNPKATYLHVCNDAALNAPAIALADLGLAPGQTIAIEELGDWNNGPAGDVILYLCAVFSSSSVLLDAAQLHRVPGAIASTGPPIISGNTVRCGTPTDIAEDFLVSYDAAHRSVVLAIPAGATHLFVAACDVLYDDNSDPDGDYAVRITAVPTAVGDGPAMALELEEPYPNPFNPATMVRYTLPETSPVTIAVYDASGHMVALLTKGVRDAGSHTARWDGRDTRGSSVTSGVYFVRLESRGITRVRKIVLLK